MSIDRGGGGGREGGMMDQASCFEFLFSMPSRGMGVVCMWVCGGCMGVCGVQGGGVGMG